MNEKMIADIDEVVKQIGAKLCTTIESKAQYQFVSQVVASEEGILNIMRVRDVVCDKLAAYVNKNLYFTGDFPDSEQFSNSSRFNQCLWVDTHIVDDGCYYVVNLDVEAFIDIFSLSIFLQALINGFYSMELSARMLTEHTDSPQMFNFDVSKHISLSNIRNNPSWMKKVIELFHSKGWSFLGWNSSYNSLNRDSKVVVHCARKNSIKE